MFSRNSILLVVSVVIPVMADCLINRPVDYIHIYLWNLPVAVQVIMSLFFAITFFSFIIYLLEYKTKQFFNYKHLPAPYAGLLGGNVLIYLLSNNISESFICLSISISTFYISLIITNNLQPKFIRLENTSHGEHPIFKEDDDEYEYTRKAARISDRVHLGTGPLLLIGEYGSGKTSLTRLIYSKLKEKSQNSPALKNRSEWIYVNVSGWGLKEPNSRARKILLAVCAELNPYVDTLVVREYCSGYIQGLFGSSSWISNLIFQLDRTNNIDIASYIQDLIKFSNKRILLVLDDFERSNQTGITWDCGVAELLDEIRSVERMQIIACVNTGATSSLDMYRIFDFHEFIPLLSDKVAQRKVIELYKRCIESSIKNNIIWPFDTPPKIPNADSIDDLVREHHRSSCWYSEIANLLETPRTMKFFKRQVIRSWNKIQGEVNLQELLLFEAIRLRIPNNGNEVLTYIRRLGQLQSGRSNDGRTKEIADIYVKIEDISDIDEKAKSSITWLIKWVTNEKPTEDEQTQAVGRGLKRSKYWDRAFSGDILANDIRDQRIFKEIKGFMDGISDSDQILANNIVKVDYYADAFEESIAWVASNWNQFTKLFSKVIDIELDLIVENNFFSGEKSFIIFWRHWINNHQFIRGADQAKDANEITLYEEVYQFDSLQYRKSVAIWAANRIRYSLEKSLPYAHEVYYYLTGAPDQAAILEENYSLQMRRLIYNYCRDRINSGQELLKRLQPGEAYVLYHLVFCTGGSGHTPTFNEAKDWKFMTPIIISAARINLALIQPMALFLVSNAAIAAGQRNPSYSFNGNVLIDLCDSRSMALDYLKMITTDIEYIDKLEPNTAKGCETTKSGAKLFLARILEAHDDEWQNTQSWGIP